MTVIALPEVREYLMELIQILYKKQPSAKAKQAGTSLF